MKLTPEQTEAAQVEFEKFIKEMVRLDQITVPAGWSNTCEATINHMVKKWVDGKYLHNHVQECWLVWQEQESRHLSNLEALNAALKELGGIVL